jgi:1,4-alpha-glucan branching enzyme
VDYHWKGFEWVDFHDLDGNVISFVRRGKHHDNFLLFVCVFAPQVRHGYQVGVPRDGVYQEILCSDAEQFGGSGVQNREPIRSQQGEVQGKHHFISITLPPLAVSVFRRVSD